MENRVPSASYNLSESTVMIWYCLLSTPTLDKYMHHQAYLSREQSADLLPFLRLDILRDCQKPLLGVLQDVQLNLEHERPIVLVGKGTLARAVRRVRGVRRRFREVVRSAAAEVHIGANNTEQVLLGAGPRLRQNWRRRGYGGGCDSGRELLREVRAGVSRPARAIIRDAVLSKRRRLTSTD